MESTAEIQARFQSMLEENKESESDEKICEQDISPDKAKYLPSAGSPSRTDQFGIGFVTSEIHKLAKNEEEQSLGVTNDESLAEMDQTENEAIKEFQLELEEGIGVEQAIEDMEIQEFYNDIQDQLIAEMEQDQAEDDEIEVLQRQAEETIGEQQAIEDIENEEFSKDVCEEIIAEMEPSEIEL